VTAHASYLCLMFDHVTVYELQIFVVISIIIIIIAIIIIIIRIYTFQDL